MPITKLRKPSTDNKLQNYFYCFSFSDIDFNSKIVICCEPYNQCELINLYRRSLLSFSIALSFAKREHSSSISQYFQFQNPLLPFSCSRFVSCITFLRRFSIQSSLKETITPCSLSPLTLSLPTSSKNITLLFFLYFYTSFAKSSNYSNFLPIAKSSSKLKLILAQETVRFVGTSFCDNSW